MSPSGVVYVFLAAPRTIERDIRQKELGLRTFVARGLHQDCTTAVGIATEQLDGKQGLSIDGCLVHIPKWTDELQQQLEEIQRKFQMFVAPEITTGHVDEYPEPRESGGVP